MILEKRIKPHEEYALMHNGTIRHKDAFNNELKVGDNIVIGSYLGHLYKGKVVGCTKCKIAFYYIYSTRDIDYSRYISYTDSSKVYKIT